MNTIVTLICLTALVGAAPTTPEGVASTKPEGIQDTPTIESVRPEAPKPQTVEYVDLQKPFYVRDPQNGLEVAGNNQVTDHTNQPVVNSPQPRNDESPDIPAGMEAQVLSSSYIASHPDSVLPRTDGSLMIHSGSEDNTLNGPCGSEVHLQTNGVLIINNASGNKVGEFDGAIGACSPIERIPCVLRLDAGSLVIGHYVRGQFFEPTYSTHSQASDAVVVDNGDIWLVDGNGVLLVDIKMNVPEHVFQGCM